MSTSSDAARAVAPEPPLFAIPDYRRGWLLGMAAGVARWLEFLALGIFAYQLTKSPPLVALLAIVRVAPYALLGYFVGSLTDRIDRKRWLLIGLVFMCVVSAAMAFLALSGKATYAAVVCATLATGIFWLTDMPIRRRFMLDAVGERRIGRAMGFDNITNYATRGIGPLVGGIVYQWFDAAGVFAVNFALYAVGLILAVGLTPQRDKPPIQKTASNVSAPTSATTSLLSNSRFVVILGVTMLYNLFCVPFVAMLPVFAQKDFAMTPAAIGSLAAFEGLGGVIGSIVIGMTIRPQFTFPLHLTGPLVYLSVVLALSFALLPSLTLAALIVASLGGACFTATQYALIYTTAPEHLRGRAFGFLSICIGCAMLGHWNAGLLFKYYESATALMVLALEGLVPLLALIAFAIISGPPKQQSA